MKMQPNDVIFREEIQGAHPGQICTLHMDGLAD